MHGRDGWLEESQSGSTVDEQEELLKTLKKLQRGLYPGRPAEILERIQ